MTVMPSLRPFSACLHIKLLSSSAKLKEKLKTQKRCAILHHAFFLFQQLTDQFTGAYALRTEAAVSFGAVVLTHVAPREQKGMNQPQFRPDFLPPQWEGPQGPLE